MELFILLNIAGNILAGIVFILVIVGAVFLFDTGILEDAGDYAWVLGAAIVLVLFVIGGLILKYVFGVI